MKTAAFIQIFMTYQECKAALFLRYWKGKEDSPHCRLCFYIFWAPETKVVLNTQCVRPRANGMERVAVKHHQIMVAFKSQSNLTPKIKDSVGYKRPWFDSSGSEFRRKRWWLSEIIGLGHLAEAFLSQNRRQGWTKKILFCWQTLLIFCISEPPQLYPNYPP